MSKWQSLTLRTREWVLVIRGLVSRNHPILAHLIPTRRCNLACGYCNEYNDHSDPVGTEVLLGRVNQLADLGTSIITLSGGEPLLHPELERVVLEMRRRRMIASLITNGYLLSQKRIRSLNQAGLDHLQISIDNIEPDSISVKSLKVLDKKLRYLAQEAHFKVNINTVVGGGVKNPEDALCIARRAVELGFSCTVGIVHDGSGHLRPLSDREKRVVRQVRNLGKRGYARINKYFQDSLAEGKPNNWRCRAGARYLYICEDGLVHYCSQQRGYPAIPLSRYTREDIRREYLTQKKCAPFCTISCVHQASLIDFWRAPQQSKPLVQPMQQPVPGEELVEIQ
jgi:MoaA/NifB/PqqE/SkfB family radical SAM enzyme